MSILVGAKPFDRLFIDVMTCHHGRGILLARAELAKGLDPQLRQFAQEIAQMKAWRTAWYGSGAPMSL